MKLKISIIAAAIATTAALAAVPSASASGFTRCDGDDHFVILDYLVDVDGDGAPVPGTDADEAAWVPLAEVRGLALVPGLVEFLEGSGVL